MNNVVDKKKMDSIFKTDANPENAELAKPVAILLQHSPDPDCLGAARGFATLLQTVYGLTSKIYHYGEVSHPQNKSMINVLHIELYNGDDFNLEDHCRTVVLDTDLSSTGFNKRGLQSVDVRIDHHSMDRDEDPQLKDIRPTVGSTCAIVWHYLKEFGVDLSEHADVATALVLGIKTDTMDFTSTNTSELDMEAFRNLLSYVDKIALAKLTKYMLPKNQFEIESKAFAAKEIRETVLISFIGETSEHNRDIISTIADRFARMDGMSTVVILGVIDAHLVASVRSEDTRINLSKFVSEVFGKKFSGAKEGAGGARVPLGAAFEFITNTEVKEKVMEEIVTSVKEKIFQFLGDS
jgi:nanoRNase/pAp phosphatase (c-di-AMP/oligoRNAs hydrolase)